MRRFGLTRTFALVSLLAMVALGVALVWASATLLRNQAMTAGSSTAQTYVQLALEGDTGLKDSVFTSTHVTPKVGAALCQRLHLDPVSEGTAQGSSALLNLRVWPLGNSSRPVFDTDIDCRPQKSVGAGPVIPSTGSAFPDGTRLDEAIRGQSAPAVVRDVMADSGARGAQVDARLNVYAPAYFGGESVLGVADVTLDYSATQAAVVESVQVVALVVVAGLGLLWVLLFRTVWRTSRTLRYQASETARLALLDPLTGLPNRRLLNERLERAAAASAREGDAVGLVLLDVDRFKEVNDTLGHPRGDKLLIQVADRLCSVVRESDTVARLGGDEFAVLLPSMGSVADAEVLAQRVFAVFATPFDLDGLLLHVDTSVGLAVLPDHADDITALLQRADVAMYTAKAAKAGVATYSPTGDENSPSRLVLLGDLRRALDSEGELSMHYQPKIDLRTGQVTGLEALLRWNHPQRGFIPPVDFIPLAEQTGLIKDLTARVLGLVFAQTAAWAAAGRRLPVAVNLSARNLLEPDLDEVVSGLLARHELDPDLLEFEITESAIVEDPVRAGAMLTKLTALGIGVAVDDFGIGSTSMSQLRSMPLRTLKIDRSFVTNLVSDPGGASLVRAIVELAHDFGLVAVAEGVEDAAVITVLRELGCDVAQGYHWSKPVAVSDLDDVLTRLADDASAPPPKTRRRRSRTSPVPSAG